MPRACLALEQFSHSSPGIFILVRSAMFQDHYNRLCRPGEWSLEVPPWKQQRPITYTTENIMPYAQVLFPLAHVSYT
jgi:hypothetical protein